MNIQNPKYGITGPATLNESTADSIELSRKMDSFLRDSDFFESEDAAQTRERVLGKLDFLVKSFVQKMASEDEARSYGGKIFTFGSYRLGVHDKGADIDALCVVPRHVSRKDFFSIFYEELSKDKNISELSKIEEAHVPIIKMKFHDIPIDLLFARLNIPVIKEHISLLNDSLLKSVDKKCILSLNGSRVTDLMLTLVPNTEVFHSALRAIKFWAKRRQIYGNTYGYFGGVAFSICVARVCQMYPNMCSYDILCRFFEVFAAWKWPEPVLITPIIDHSFNLPVWDPKTYPADKYHKMPVITPAYPSMCATYNVTQSTFGMIVSEFKRGNEILKNGGSLKDLLEYSDFFRRFKIFIEVHIKSEESEEYKMWEGYIESKIRILCTKLENLDNISAAIPFPKAFRIDCGSSSEESSVSVNETSADGHLLEKSKKGTACWFFIACEISLSKSANKRIYIDQPIKDFLDFTNSWDLKTKGMSIEINSRKKKDVQTFLRGFQT